MTTTSWDELIKNSAGSFDPLPNGDYDVVCVDAQPAQSTTGKAMIKAKFKVQGGPHDGRHLWNQFTISPENPNALSFFFQHMKVLGMDNSFFAQLPPVNADLGANDPSLQYIASNMLNRAARVTVNQRAYAGQMRNNITALKSVLGPIGAGTVAPQMAAPGIPAATPQVAVPQPQAPAQVPQMQVPQAAPVLAPTPAPAPAPVAAPQPVAPPAPPAPVSVLPAQPVQPQVIGPPVQQMSAPQPQQPQPPQDLAF